MDSLLEGAATGAACATALALPLKSWVFAVDDTATGLANSDCCAGIFAAARCAIALADRASDFTLATPAVVPDASADGAGAFAPGPGAAGSDRFSSDRFSTTVGILVGEGFADASPVDGVAPSRLPAAAG